MTDYRTVWYIKCFNAWGAVVNYDDVAYTTKGRAQTARTLLSEPLRNVTWVEKGIVERHVNQK